MDIFGELEQMGRAFDLAHKMRQSYEAIYLDVAFMLSKRFGKKADDVHGVFIYARGEESLDEEMAEYGVKLTNVDREIIKTIKEADDLLSKAKRKLLLAQAFHESEQMTNKK